MSERRACRVIGTDRTSVRYQGVRPADNALRERLKALAEERRRFGYRRLHVLLRREGLPSDSCQRPATPDFFSNIGHEDQFPSPPLNGDGRLDEATFAGMGGKEEDAPRAAIRSKFEACYA
jgi:hypothetical protein